MHLMGCGGYSCQSSGSRSRVDTGVPICTGGWGMFVMAIFWVLIIILLAFIVWFFYRILAGGRRWREPKGKGRADNEADDREGREGGARASTASYPTVLARATLSVLSRTRKRRT